MRTIPWYSPLLFAGLLSTISCGGGGGPTGLTPGLVIAVAPTGGSGAQGGSVAFAVSATGINGFTGAATFAVTGLPTGVTAAISNIINSGGVTTASVLLTIGAAAAPGASSLTVTASGTGVASVNTTFALTITAVAAPGYSLAPNPATLTVGQGGNANSTITITRTGGFAGSVAFTATGASAGLTAAFNPTATTGNSTTLTVSASAGATTGTITLTVTGTAAGLANQTTTVQVTVNAPSGGSTVILDYTGCGPFIKPVWLAFQDGNGAWTQVTPTNSVYQFTLTSSKGGYAFATVSGANSTVGVVLVTKAEIGGGTPVVFCPPQVLKNVNVTVTGLAAADVAFVALGGASNFAQSSTPNPISLNGVQSGLQDLVAYRTATLGPPAASDRAIITRGLNVANGGSAGTLDFVGGPLITPVAATITVAGVVAGDALSGSMQYFTGAPGSCTIASLYSIPSSTAAARNLFGIPAASQQPNDLHSISLTGINGSTTRSILQSFHSFVDQTITLGANLPTPTVTSPAQAGYKRLQAVGTIPVDYPTSASLTYTQQGTAKSAVITATLGWLGSTAATLTFPDFSAVSGWDNSWVPAAGSTVDWTFMATDINYTGQPCTEGARLRAGRFKGVN